MEEKIPLNNNMIKSFIGKSDVVIWLKKIRLVTKLKKITNVESFISLFLEGNALVLYLKIMDKEHDQNQT